VDARRLTYFVAIAEELHFGKAARRLKVVQPALSQQIKKLEKELGVQLFVRDRRNVNLSEAGQALLPVARQALAQLDRVREVAQERKLLASKRVIIGTPAALVSPLPFALMERFQSAHPDVNIEVVSGFTDDLVPAIQEGRVHLAFVRRSDPRIGGMGWMVLEREELSVVMPRDHPLARLNQIPMLRLHSQSWVLFSRKINSTFHDELIARLQFGDLRQERAFPVIAAEEVSVEAVLMAVARGKGIALLNPAQTRLASGTSLVCRPLAPPGLHVHLAAIWLRTHASGPLGRFLEFLKQHVDA
jgi:DNA-binding transcriptional LysR family regulator